MPRAGSAGAFRQRVGCTSRCSREEPSGRGGTAPGRPYGAGRLARSHRPNAARRRYIYAMSPGLHGQVLPRLAQFRYFLGAPDKRNPALHVRFVLPLTGKRSAAPAGHPGDHSTCGTCMPHNEWPFCHGLPCIPPEPAASIAAVHRQESFLSKPDRTSVPSGPVVLNGRNSKRSFHYFGPCP